MKEVWKRVKGYEELYEVCNDGRVKSIKKGIILKPLNNKGYVRVGLFRSGKYEYIFIHKLVALHFLSNKDNRKQINHKDGNKLNNSADNLEWCDSYKNINHRMIVVEGRKKYGIRKRPNSTKWQTRISVNGKRICLGDFDNKEEAYEAFYIKYTEVHGEPPW